MCCVNNTLYDMFDEIENILKFDEILWLIFFVVLFKLCEYKLWYYFFLRWNFIDIICCCELRMFAGMILRINLKLGKFELLDYDYGVDDLNTVCGS